tara:strand:- start:139 stop:525 length:387 start_codon:yes stop_codon:yes gene_type:complete
MTLYLNGSILEIPGPDAQAVLATAHKARTRVECRCTHPAQEMYVVKIGHRFYVKRMPGTGERHAPQCDAFEAPEHLSGLSELSGTAIVESAEEGTTASQAGLCFDKTRQTGSTATSFWGNGDRGHQQS